MRNKFLLLLFTALCAGPLLLSPVGAARAAGESAAQLVEKGNLAYQQEQYLNAARFYREAIQAGADNGHVFYNLGNTYSRLEQPGRAIAAYRRALLDLPGDPDVLHNLQLTRKETTDRIVDDSQLLSSVTHKLLEYYPRLSTAEMEFALLACYSLGWVVFVAGSLFRLPRAKSFSYICAAAALLFGALTFGVGPGRDGSPRLLIGEARSETPAVVTATETKLYSGDSDTYQVVFVLHDGAEVLTRERRPGWVEVLLPDGRRGWAKTGDLEILA